MPQYGFNVQANDLLKSRTRWRYYDNGQVCCLELLRVMQLLLQGFYGQTYKTIRDGIRD
jgi:hypothetical protein